MPLLIVLKNPPVTLSANGKLDKKTIRVIRGVFGKGVVLNMTDGLPGIILRSSSFNVSYIKEITVEKFKEMERKKKEQDEAMPPVRMSPGLIQKPGFVPPRNARQ